MAEQNNKVDLIEGFNVLVAPNNPSGMYSAQMPLELAETLKLYNDFVQEIARQGGRIISTFQTDVWVPGSFSSAAEPRVFFVVEKLAGEQAPTAPKMVKKTLPLTNQALRTRAAQALANFQVPDYSDFSPDQVYEAFAEVWENFNADPEWLEKFISEVYTFSGGQTSLEKGSPDSFNMRVRGPAEYLLLKSDVKVRRVILLPNSAPIIFDK